LTRNTWNNVAILLAIGAYFVSGRISSAAPDDVEADAPAAVQVNERVFIQEANFDQWVFQGRGDEGAARQRIESTLKLRIDDVHRICDLSEAQKQKLALAARGDIKRFFELVAAAREEFRAVQNDPNAFNAIWQDIQPLQQKMANGLFGETSLFAKTLRKTLTAEQSLKYKANMDERHRYRHKAMVAAALATLENSIPLRNDQHAALVKLIVDKSPPPQASGQYNHYVVMYQISKLPENEVNALLDEHQQKLLSQQLDQFRGMAQMLIQSGVLPKEAKDEAEEGKSKPPERAAAKN
jgi:hypothetical protein